MGRPMVVRRTQSFERTASPLAQLHPRWPTHLAAESRDDLLRMHGMWPQSIRSVWELPQLWGSYLGDARYKREAINLLGTHIRSGSLGNVGHLLTTGPCFTCSEVRPRLASGIETPVRSAREERERKILMPVLVSTDEERSLIRTTRAGRGLLDSLFAELYCSELASNSELVHKISITLTAVLSTSAAVSLFQAVVPKASPYLAAGSAALSVLGSTFAWRSQALSFAKASKSYGDLSTQWYDLWEAVRLQKGNDEKRAGELERESKKIADSISPHSLRMRLARKCQARIRKQVGLTT